MNSVAMSNPHQSNTPWSWRLEPRQATTLAADDSPRWLHVEDGKVWVTAREAGPQAEQDIWLGAGESLPLPAGSEWVLQAWPSARLSLLQAAPAARRAGPSRRVWWRPSWLRALA
jgi:hypothetical protein